MVETSAIDYSGNKMNNEDEPMKFKCAKCRMFLSVYDERCFSCDLPNKHYEEKKSSDIKLTDWICNCNTINTLPDFSCRSKFIIFPLKIL